MKETIVDVHGVCDAGSFVFRDTGEQVTCFALVSAVDHEHPAFSPTRQIIALQDGDLGVDLLGKEIEPYMSDVEKKRD